MNNVASSRQSALNNLLKQLDQRKEEIGSLLPPDLPFDRFYATIHQALRQYPKLLDCEPKSLLNAVIKAAYDGLRVDGREAVITVDEVTFGKNTNDERKVKMARYMPMAFGIIQQILRGGEVLAMEVDVIRQNDEYDVRRGTDPGIFHKPYLEGERGSIIAAYSIATLKNGVKTFEVLDRTDLAAIRGAASTQNVWNNWEGEMSKKSAARRHRKTLPLGDRDIVIRDGEAEELYPEFADQKVLAPAQTQRPTRAAIANQMGTESGQAIDLQDEDEAVIIDGNVEEKPKRSRRKKAEPTAGDGHVGFNQASDEAIATGAQLREEERGREGAGDIPEDENAWRGWAVDVERALGQCTNAADVGALSQREAARLEAASEQRRNWIKALIADRLTDFATGGAE